MTETAERHEDRAVSAAGRAGLRIDRQRLRLASGLVLFAFAATHFLNHALGLVDVTWMDAAQAVRRAFWRSPPGTVLLYGALVLHVGLGLFKLVRRNTWRMPLWEALQIGLGLLIPVWLMQHVVATRGMNLAFGIDDTYTRELRILWPSTALQQTLLLYIVWLHGCIGIHHWLNTKSWYERWAPWLLGLAVLVPVTATAGWIEAARRLEEFEFEAPAWTREQFFAAQGMINRGHVLLIALALATVLAIAARRVVTRLGGGFLVRYAGGRVVRARPGPTLLEISRANGIPHASVCGGRGRCTTCRVLVTDGADQFPAAEGAEAAALARISAPEGVRLACQIRPQRDVTVRKLVPVVPAEPTGRARDPYRWGVERRVTVMFADLRAFTTLAEQLYPYDSVFLLNRYFEVMGEIIRGSGGMVDKFLGDGIMALFGVDPAPGAGSRDAIVAARAMQAALAELNAEFAMTLPQPLRMGIGIHTGPAVLGRVGSAAAGGTDAALTALGDTVNIASRLETLTKDYGSLAVVSEATLKGSGFALPGCDVHEIAVRGRRERIHVYVVPDFALLAEAPAKKVVST
ncbi:adenylate/guanylate cyclase domain-containing protein [Chelatococcus sp. SYSU_G07232]|uniref:Adenylate/guanylate cyclase domain-containing protein n=1 Tax=Chelatococcus albus TaxID=3047466 RepID=A0ABT7AJB4_9HYPH|nr:adenylate/guanylate cyclase domain-containing protein [Chelatococcus sp. SYSU_G07232]MDJ1159448.1 adenylate/guanylate cyclase domain-containing protein [Chelatococcus sp. SYSU_G07232]